MSPSPTTSSYSTNSDPDRYNERYHGTILSPQYGMANMLLRTVKLTLERMDAHGMLLETNDAHAHGIVVHIGLASEDGSMDYDLTASGERLLTGDTTQSPMFIDGNLVVEFKFLKVHCAGKFRFRVQAFDINKAPMNLPTIFETPTLVVRGPDAMFSGISDPLIVYAANILLEA